LDVKLYYTIPYLSKREEPPLTFTSVIALAIPFQATSEITISRGGGRGIQIGTKLSWDLVSKILATRLVVVRTGL